MKIFYIAALAALTAACASTPPLGRVIPGEAGIYEAVSKGETQDDALNSALHTAETTCKARQLRHIVLDHKIEYKGVVSEGTNQVINKTSSVLENFGIWVPTLSGEDDYKMTLRFKCEA